MRAAWEIGMQPEVFFNTLPYIYNILAEGRKQKLQREFDLAITTAWYTAALTKGKKLPKLKLLLSSSDEKPKTTTVRGTESAMLAFFAAHNNVVAQMEAKDK